MKTKIIEEVQTIKKEIFIADDGTEFENAVRCKVYERSVERRKMLEISEILPRFQNVHGGLISEDDYLDWAYCQNKEEAKALMYELLSEEENELYGERQLECLVFPCWVVVCSDENGYGFISSAEKELADLENMIKEVRETMEELHHG